MRHAVLLQRLAGILRPASSFSAARQLGILRPVSSFSAARQLGILRPVRSFSAARQLGILRPVSSFSAARQLGILDPPARCFSSTVKLAFMQPSTGERASSVQPLLPAHRAEMVRAPQGIIRPGSGFSSVPFSGPQRIITQTSCSDPTDSTLSENENICTYFQKYPAATDVQNSLFGDLDQKTFMLSELGRNFWTSAIDLVAMNRRRGKCIANYLQYDNLVVFPFYGSMGLKFPVGDDIFGEDPRKFKGYLALRTLFIDVMIRLYGTEVLNMITDDILHWLTLLKTAAFSKSDEDLAIQHAALLSRNGRAWLSIKVATLLRSELYGLHMFHEFIYDVYFSLHTMGNNLDQRHPFFKEWRMHALKFGEVMGRFQPILEAEDDIQREKEEALKENGYWLVGINRHGILHPYSARLTQVSPVRRNYSPDDVVDLLHQKYPLYLPKVQSVFMDHDNWDLLNMECYWPKNMY